MGEWKVLLRSGAYWPASGAVTGRSTGIGNSDGWFGGKNSSDAATDGYAMPAGAARQGYTVKCPPPPQNVSNGFPCQLKQGAGADSEAYACLFNVVDDPCEHHDRSLEQPDILRRLLARLDDYRASAVTQAEATPTPDGPSCPAKQVFDGCNAAGAEAPMNCSAYTPC